MARDPLFAFPNAQCPVPSAFLPKTNQIPIDRPAQLPYPAPMDTTQTPIRPDLNSLIRLYFDPNLEIPDVADRLGISILDLSDYLLEPHVRAAVRRVRAMYRARAPHLAAASLHRNLKLLDSIAVLPDNPTPADRDRLRRTLDSSRRAADLLFKTTRPTTSRVTPSRTTTLRASTGTPPSLQAPSVPSVPSVPSSSPAGAPPSLKAPSVPSSSSAGTPTPTTTHPAPDRAPPGTPPLDHSATSSELTTANPALAAEIAASLQSTLATTPPVARDALPGTPPLDHSATSPEPTLAAA